MKGGAASICGAESQRLHGTTWEMGDGVAADKTEWPEFERFRHEVKASLDAELAAWLGARVGEAARHGTDLEAMADAVRGLVLRGGKRLRAVLLAAAYEACGGDGGPPRVVMAGVALELLQAYLLIHDDWMDRDEVRRGGPTVHALLRDRFGERRVGDAGAILAGDYASALAHKALLEVELPAERLLAAARELAQVEIDVTSGQLLDVRASAHAPAGGSGVEMMHALKTGSYTVRGPVLMGAALAGASRAVMVDFARFAAPLGVAFQLRDDLLGAFGDPKVTGKPAGSDLREGKHTALIAELARDGEAQRLLPRVLGVEDASADEVDAVLARMGASGARARVEARVDALMAEASSVVLAMELAPSGRAILSGAIAALGTREG